MNGYLGDFATGATVYVPFHTFNSTGASVTLTGLAVTDIEVYKDGGTTQRASDAGYTLLDTDGIDFDGITGIHGFKIDLSDNTDAGFYAAAHDYFVVVSAVTVDSQTVSFVACSFSIENRNVKVNITMISDDATAASNLEAMLDGTGGVKLSLSQLNIVAASNDSAIVATGAGSGHGFVATGGGTGAGIRAIGGGTSGAGVHASGTAGNSAGATFAGQGSASGLNATGGATGHGIRGVGGATSGDGMNLSAPTAGDGLEAVGAGGGYDVNADIQGALSGAVGSVTGAVGSVTGNVGGNVTGSVGSVVGAVGSVTGNVGGNVAGSVASVTAGVNATQINSSANAAARLALSAAQMIPGTVDSTAFSPTTTVFEADDITEATADHYNGRLVLWTSGALVGQVTDVTDYALSGGRGRFTVTTMTEAAANNDTFILV